MFMSFIINTMGVSTGAETAYSSETKLYHKKLYRVHLSTGGNQSHNIGIYYHTLMAAT